MQQVMRTARTSGDVTAAPRHDVTARQRTTPSPAATPAEQRGNRCYGDAERQQQYHDPDETRARLTAALAFSAR